MSKKTPYQLPSHSTTFIQYTIFYFFNSHSGNLLGEYNGYKDVQEAVKSVDLGGDESSRVFAHAEAYNNGVTLSVVVFELLRNMILALVSVFICVLFLMANFFATLIVCGTVSITLLDVAGKEF